MKYISPAPASLSRSLSPPLPPFSLSLSLSLCIVWLCGLHSVGPTQCQFPRTLEDFHFLFLPSFPSPRPLSLSLALFGLEIDNLWIKSIISFFLWITLWLDYWKEEREEEAAKFFQDKRRWSRVHCTLDFILNIASRIQFNFFNLKTYLITLKLKNSIRQLWKIFSSTVFIISLWTIQIRQAKLNLN